METDQFASAYPDFLIVFAAGNYGMEDFGECVTGPIDVV